MRFDLTHARHDPAHCLAPGLFRSLKRGERKKLKLDVTYQHGPNTTLRFIGFEPLNAQDMRLLQGIVALSGPNGVILSDEPKSDIGHQLRILLDPKLEAARADALVVKGTLGQLMREIGYSTDGKQTREDLKASLLRMANVTLHVCDKSREATFHLLSYAFDNLDGSLFVALNPRVAEAVIGNAAHTRIEMSEVRALQSDPTRLVHQRLCGWISPGKSGRIELDTACGYVWPDSTDNPNTLKTRRQTARKAFTELRGLDWTVDEYATAKFEIRRPQVAKGLKN